MGVHTTGESICESQEQRLTSLTVRYVARGLRGLSAKERGAGYIAVGIVTLWIGQGREKNQESGKRKHHAVTTPVTGWASWREDYVTPATNSGISNLASHQSGLRRNAQPAMRHFQRTWIENSARWIAMSTPVYSTTHGRPTQRKWLRRESRGSA